MDFLHGMDPLHVIVIIVGTIAILVFGLPFMIFAWLKARSGYRNSRVLSATGSAVVGAVSFTARLTLAVFLGLYMCIATPVAIIMFSMNGVEDWRPWALTVSLVALAIWMMVKKPNYR